MPARAAARSRAATYPPWAVRGHALRPSWAQHLARVRVRIRVRVGVGVGVGVGVRAQVRVRVRVRVRISIRIRIRARVTVVRELRDPLAQRVAPTVGRVVVG